MQSVASMPANQALNHLRELAVPPGSELKNNFAKLPRIFYFPFAVFLSGTPNLSHVRKKA
jgi:hypothetical protein